MTLTGTSARFELVANADLTSENISGSAQIGTASTAIAYTTPPDIAYSLGMYITSGDTLTLDLETAAVTGGVTGTSQVETFTVVAASGCTSDGTCNVVVTGAALTGSPITVPVALTTATHTTATLIRTAINVELSTNAVIAARYAVGGSSASGTLTDLLKRDNDATLNVAIPAGLGITAALSSANTTAGVGESKAYRINGTAWDQTNYQGEPLETATKLQAILIRSSTSSVGVTSIAGLDKTDTIAPGAPTFSMDPNGEHPWAAEAVTFEATGGDVILTIDIQAGT